MIIVEELILPALLTASRFVFRLIADLLLEFGVLAAVERLRYRRLRADARAWVQASDWAAFRERYASASAGERRVLLRAGDGRPELAEVYAEALNGEPVEAMQAAQMLRQRRPLPEVVERAARARAELGPADAAMVRRLL